MNETQYRGTRALVLGMPFGLTHGAWRRITAEAVRTLDLELAVSLDGAPSECQIRDAASSINAAIILLVGGVSARHARGAGLPILRARKDGRIEAIDR